MAAEIANFKALLASFPRPDDLVAYTGTWREAAVQRGLLPVYADWECCYALTEQAEPVYSADTEWTTVLPLTNARHRFVVLAQAAERLPELEALRPVRGPDDPTCESCKGSGRVPVAGEHAGVFMCECAGLGWYPAGTQLGPY